MGVAVLHVGDETSVVLPVEATVLVEFNRIGLTLDVAGTGDTLLISAFWDKLFF